MKKQSSNKSLLVVPWLLKALNEELYEGLRWDDIENRIFYIQWTHKSAEQWSQSEIEVYRAWAQHKGKLNGKNEKQLKATFRCALNSKKELQEVKRTRRGRYWQFINPAISPKKETNTKRGQRKYKETENNFPAPIPIDIIPNEQPSSLPPASVAPSITDEASSAALPPFESFCSFVPETSPYHSNEITFNITGDRIIHTPSPDLNRLTPPMDISQLNYHSPSPNNFEQPDRDIWQPNFMTTTYMNSNNRFNPISFNDDDFSCMNQTEMNPKLFIDDNIKPEIMERDQFVPVMDDSQNNFMYRQSNIQKVTENIHMSEIMRFDDDCLFGGNADPVAFEMFVQELSRLSPKIETSAYNVSH